MSEKIIEIPSPITIMKGPAAGRTVSFFDWAAGIMDDPKWGTSEANLNLSAILEAQLERLKDEGATQWRVRTTPDWEVLSEIAQRPGVAYNTPVVKYLTRFIRAVVEAKPVEPS